MGKRRDLLERMADQFISSDDRSYQTIVEIAGEKRVLIENHLGVAAYGREKIMVKVNFGFVCICGSQLELVKMTGDQLIVFGKIGSVTLLRRS